MTFEGNYNSRNVESLTERVNQAGYVTALSPFKSGIKEFKPGLENRQWTLRILPRPDCPMPPWMFQRSSHYGVDLFIHTIPGSFDKIVSLSNHQKVEPIQDPMVKLINHYKDTHPDENKVPFSAKKRVATWVLDRNNPDAQPLLWLMPPIKVDAVLATQCSPMGRNGGNILIIDHSTKGYDIQLNVTKQGSYPEYNVMIQREESPIAENPAITANILDYVSKNKVEDVAIFHTPAELVSILQRNGLLNADGEPTTAKPLPSVRNEGSNAFANAVGGQATSISKTPPPLNNPPSTTSANAPANLPSGASLPSYPIPPAPVPASVPSQPSEQVVVHPNPTRNSNSF